jgi:predicted amidohydrolase YtcJ
MRDLYAEPYSRGGSYRGLQTMPDSAFQRAVRTLNALHWRVATHAVGDAAIDLVLDAYAAADAETSIAGRRWVVEHAFIARPEQLHRMKTLGLVVSAQDHLWLAGPVLVKYWGPGRAALTTPMRAFLDSGLVVASGTDSPVIPYPPLKTFYHFVTRNTISGGVIGREQAISRAEALRAATMGNALLNFEEHAKGSIEVGKLADLVVLNDDIMRCTDAALSRLAPVMTIVNGRVVYDAAGPARR